MTSSASSDHRSSWHDACFAYLVTTVLEHRKEDESHHMPPLDIVLYGATGFVGQLVAEYLARHAERSRFSWAIAGRNPDKLSALRTSLADAAVEIIVADTGRDSPRRGRTPFRTNRVN